MNRNLIAKLELILRRKFSKLYDGMDEQDRPHHVFRAWTKCLKELGCNFSYKGYLEEPAKHPEGFVLVSDPVQSRAIMLPKELALKALFVGELP